VTKAGRKSNTRFGDGQLQEPLLEFRGNIGSFRLTMVLQKDKGFSIANPQKVLPLPEIALESHVDAYRNDQCVYLPLSSNAPGGQNRFSYQSL
jgi:hypothetical protein